MKIKFKKIRKNAVLPKPATTKSGGLDLTASKIEILSNNEVMVYTGLAMVPQQDTHRKFIQDTNEGELKFLSDYQGPNYRIRIAPRSSFTKYNWILQNSPALGDADYTGEYMLRFRAIPTSGEITGEKEWEELNLSYDEFPYKVGDRCAQMWVEEVIPIEFEEVEEFKSTERGTGRFGSTGK